MIPGFDEQLLGGGAGEEATVRVRFPDDYAKEDLAGKDAEFQVRVGSLRRREVPALDDEFAKDLGDELSRSTRCERRFANRSVSRASASRGEQLRRTLLESLIARTPFDVPPGLVEERLHRRLHNASHDLERRGASRSAVDRQMERWEHEWRPLVEREVREEWLLAEVARVNQITASDLELDARIDRMAEEQGTEAAKLHKAYQDAGVLEAIRGQLVEEKAVEFLLAEAKVDEVPGS